MRTAGRDRIGLPALVTALLLGLTTICSGDSKKGSSQDDFGNKSIEELMNIDVTSVSRKEQKLSKIPAAVYVITQEAIKRSGATTIPDLLRMAPGVQVAQVQAGRWAVSVRGFNGIYSNKLLVLVDGRTVYSPALSGVYWEQLDVPLDTIDRIEVIRGPGATVWGANAVNGVISIVTKPASETQGTRINVGGGSRMFSDYEARFGSKLGHLGAYRVFGDFKRFGSQPMVDGVSGKDGWLIGHGGFRADLSSGNGKDTLLLEGNAVSESGQQPLARVGPPPRAASVVDSGTTAFDGMVRWTRKHSDRAETTLQVYNSGYSRADSNLRVSLNSTDIDVQNHIRFGSRNDIVWGGGFRFTSDYIRPTVGMEENYLTVGLNAHQVPPRMTYSLLSGFFQDELSLGSNTVLTFGSKFEHNAFSGFEYEPTFKLAWNPKESITVWGSASKPVRIPSRLDTGLQVDLPLLYIGQGVFMNQSFNVNPKAVSETVHDYEAGLRLMPSSRISLDFAGFVSQYRDLSTSYPGISSFTFLPSGAGVLNIPIYYQNGLGARSLGGEATATWNVVPRWKLAGSYSHLQVYANRTPPLAEIGLNALSYFLPPYIMEPFLQSLAKTQLGYVENGSPQHQFSLQSYFDLSSKTAIDVSTYYTGALQQTSVPAHTRLDARFGHKFAKGLELSIVGQDLLRPRHFEFEDTQQLKSTQVQRGIFGRLSWSF